MKLAIHIGFHKTGTSSIQAFSKANRKMLAQKGILYPKKALHKMAFSSTPSSEAGHRGFNDVLSSPLNDKAKNLMQLLLDEAAAYDGIHTILLSSETFSAPRIKLSTSLFDALKPFFDEVEIIVYLRRQDSWADSFYREILCWPRRRWVRSFSQFKESFLLEWLDYAERLKRWEDIFGTENMRVHSYDDRARKNIIEDFFAGLGLDRLDPAEFEFPGRNNPSLPVNLVEFMIGINRKKLSPKQRSKVTNRLFEKLMQSKQKVEIESPLLTPAISEEFKNEYMQMNREIWARYGIENGEGLCFGGELPAGGSEITLDAEQLQKLEQYAEELAGRTKRRVEYDYSRKDHGRVGISCLLNEDADQVKVFVGYHLALGVERIRLYFDNPDDPMIAYDYGSEKVEAVPCNSEFWQEKLGREPHNNGEKLTVCHTDGLNYLNHLDDIDWAINLDADELLYVHGGGSLREYLTSVDRRYLQVQVRPLEAIFTRPEDSKLFSARYFKVPRQRAKKKLWSYWRNRQKFAQALFVRGMELTGSLPWLNPLLLKYSDTLFMFRPFLQRDEDLYRKHMPQIIDVMRDGFLAHRLGRVFTRHGIELDRVTSHKPESSERGLKIKTLNNRLFVLHYDAVDFAAWHLKWHRRIFGSTTASAIHDKRRVQQDMFREAHQHSEQAVHDLFDSFFVFPDESIDEFKGAGLMVEIENDLLQQVKSENAIE